ncbi:hypothetical protein DPMN_021604 [Dreissena polymorpha]|uniref:Uncharacterized protein n=1 Tax=Dreissena polymorpha TaxID=45954 RepID=A0A9D4NN28_DREPO|nr:hypothetical protein DPMN_021604 [Dreissena polymorpha]
MIITLLSGSFQRGTSVNIASSCSARTMTYNDMFVAIQGKDRSNASSASNGSHGKIISRLTSWST